MSEFMRILFFVLVYFFYSCALFSLPVLNPANPDLLRQNTFLCYEDSDIWSVKLGYRGDFVFDRKMQYFSFFAPAHITKFSISTNAAMATLNLWKRADIFFYAGAIQPSINEKVLFPPNIPFVGGNTERVTKRFATRGVFGVGAKAILWKCNWGNPGTTYISIDGQYEKSEPMNVRLYALNDMPLTFFGRFSMQYREAQIALGLAHRFHNIIPYTAVKWSKVKTKDLDFYNVFIGFLPTLMRHRWLETNRRSFGYVVGVTLVDVSCMNITAEARFVDERALSVTADLRF